MMYAFPTRFMTMSSSTLVPKEGLESTYMMYAFPTRFMLCMIYAFLNRPFYTRRIKLGK